jgi:hypothetical protein
MEHLTSMLTRDLALWISDPLITTPSGLTIMPDSSPWSRAPCLAAISLDDPRKQLYDEEILIDILAGISVVHLIQIFRSLSHLGASK